ncbi:MAG: hypothetical protein ACI883_001449 [Candidatus Azotimanducaceae bacterium]|jgi:hypothetical protein|tara:strand:+ start:633 stop:890 length:258 start_codon:yes stop_codon:yes gene_type:complete
MYAEFSAYPTTRNWLPSGKSLRFCAGVWVWVDAAVGAAVEVAFEVDDGIAIKQKLRVTVKKLRLEGDSKPVLMQMILICNCVRNC